MKLPNKQGPRQTVFNHSIDIELKDYMNLSKKRTSKRYFVLVTDATRASDNPLRFRKNLLERTQKLIMTIEDKITDEKL